MKSPSLIVALALSGFAIVFSDPAVAQGFTGNVEIRTYSLDTQALFELTGDDVQAIMTVPIDAIAAAAGVEAEAYTVKVRGTVVHTTMEMGEMTVDYAANRFTMYNPRNDTHTTWTGEELKQLMSSMMGGAGGENPGGAIAAAMAQRRQAMGAGDPVEPEGPYSLNRSDDCGDWWGGHMGTVSLEGNPMQEAWVMHVCVTQDYRDAWDSMKAMKEAGDQFTMGMADQDSEDAMESAITERGLPMVTRLLKKGGGMTPSLAFELTVVSIAPGLVSAEEVAVKGTEVPLQQFMERMMGGARRR